MGVGGETTMGPVGVGIEIGPVGVGIGNVVPGMLIGPVGVGIEMGGVETTMGPVGAPGGDVGTLVPLMAFSHVFGPTMPSATRAFFV
jgi:hypothetical protein